MLLIRVSRTWVRLPPPPPKPSSQIFKPSDKFNPSIHLIRIQDGVNQDQAGNEIADRAASRHVICDPTMRAPFARQTKEVRILSNKDAAFPLSEGELIEIVGAEELGFRGRSNVDLPPAEPVSDRYPYTFVEMKTDLSRHGGAEASPGAGSACSASPRRQIAALPRHRAESRPGDRSSRRERRE